MTAPTAPAGTPGTARSSSAAPTAERTAGLRTLLRADAALCAATGLLGAAAPATVADLLGPDVSTTAVRVVGLALLVYALDLAVTSRAAARWQRPAVLGAGVGNLAWDATTVGLVLSGAFSATGAAVALAVGAVVGVLGLLQLRAVRR